MRDKNVSQSRFAHLLFLGLVTTVIFTHNLYICSIFVVREPDSLSDQVPPPVSIILAADSTQLEQQCSIFGLHLQHV